jgi:hypothetical protein
MLISVLNLFFWHTREVFFWIAKRKKEKRNIFHIFLARPLTDQIVSLDFFPPGILAKSQKRLPVPFRTSTKNALKEKVI